MLKSFKLLLIQFSRYPERFVLQDTVSDIDSNNIIIGPSHNIIQVSENALDNGLFCQR